jgi:hypothetical protein
MSKHSETVTLGYAAFSASHDAEFGLSKNKQIVTQARIVPLRIRSVVTTTNVIPTDVSLDGASVAGITTSAQSNGAGVPLKPQDTDGFKFELRPVRALGVIQVDGALSLVALDSLNSALPKNATLVGVLSVQSVARLSCFDSETNEEFDLGFVVGQTQPAAEYLSRINQANYPEFEEFMSWAAVASLRRAQFISAQDEKSALDEIKFTASGNQVRDPYPERPKVTVEEPEQDILIEFSDVDLFNRAKEFGYLNYRTGAGGYFIKRTAEALMALRKARTALKAEGVTVPGDEQE